MSRLVYSSLTDEETDLPVKLATSQLATSQLATSQLATSQSATSDMAPSELATAKQDGRRARSRVRVIGSTVHVSGAVTALVIDRVCAAVDHLHSLGATGIRVEMDDADSSVGEPQVRTTMPVALTG